MARLIIGLVALWFGCVPAAAELVKLEQFTVAGWDAAIYGDLNKGKIDNCMAWGRYKSNVAFYIIVHRDYTWSLGFSNPDWRIPRGPFRLAYRFDDGHWFTADVLTVDSTIFFLEMPPDSTQVTLFRRSRIMEISFSQGEYRFSLDGTARMLSTLAGCIEVGLEAEKSALAKKSGTKARVKSAAAKAKVATAKAKAAAAKPKANKPADAGNEADDEPRESTGTGFIVSKAGHILTNNHVVKKCAAITVSRTGDLTRTVSIVRTDVTNDLAVLKMDTALPPEETARFRTRSLRAGESIATYGFPLAGTLSASGNIVSGNVSSLAGLGDDVRLLQISAPIQPGNSGGPLMDMTGAVVGIVNGKLNELAALEIAGTLPQNVNFSIKANVGLNFLDAHSIPYETSGDSTTLDLPAIADKAKKFTVFISCRR